MGFTSSECPSVWGYPAAAFKPGLIKCQIGGASALKGEGQGYQIDLKSWEGEWRTNALVMNEINLHCNNINIKVVFQGRQAETCQLCFFFCFFFPGMNYVLRESLSSSPRRILAGTHFVYH